MECTFNVGTFTDQLGSAERDVTAACQVIEKLTGKKAVARSLWGDFIGSFRDGPEKFAHNCRMFHDILAKAGRESCMLQIMSDWETDREGIIAIMDIHASQRGVSTR